METTAPVWISAAAALVTAGGMRLVAPTWSSGPKGDAFTKLLQSACAKATPKLHRSANADNATLATIEVGFMIASLVMPVQLNLPLRDQRSWQASQAVSTGVAPNFQSVDGLSG